MTMEEKARIILHELDKQYAVSSYLEEDALQGIMEGLKRIEKKEGQHEHSNVQH